MTEHYSGHTGRRGQLGEDVFKILRLLSSQEDLSQRDISGHINISLGKTNYMLKSLAKKGFVKIKNFMSKGQKLNKVKYILTRKGMEQQAHLTYYYLKLREKEYIDLKKETQKMGHP
ncbi:MAG: MarR family EPS-associated transcriptional regulator [Candidatus Omnitrophica bacterium]|nr:MarR family EPS-associated transcriptional regulator [Candidatus Omnitrophota bacterium]